MCSDLNQLWIKYTKVNWFNNKNFAINKNSAKKCGIMKRTKQNDNESINQHAFIDPTQ